MTNFQKGIYIGIDIGGTKIDAIVWFQGKIRRDAQIPTPKNRKAFLASLASLVENLKQAENVKGIGIACAGAIDKNTGMIINSPNMKFLNGLKLGQWTAKKFRVPVKLDNDTNCFLRGEHRFGQARGKRNVVALTLGTGVGGAVLIDGKLLIGQHGSGGELGHIIIHDGKSFEDLTSSHLFKKYQMGGALIVQKKAEAGNQKAKKIYRELGSYLGIGLASLINVFDPELIILGGGISRGWHLYQSETLVSIKKFTLTSLKYLPVIKTSKLEHAGALGAVSLFLKR